MKSLLVLIVFLGTFCTVNAQLEYDKVIGSSFGIGYASSSGLGPLRVNPYVGKYINKRLLIGVQLNTSYDQRNGLIRPFGINDRAVVDETRFSVGASIFARYITNPDQKFKFYLKPYSTFTYESRKERSAQHSRIRNSRALSTGLDLGLQFPVSKRLNMIVEGNVMDIQIDNVSSRLNRFSIIPENIHFGLEYKF